MKTQDIKIFVIIVTYKGHRWYDRCFTSLRESSIPVQTIVVDNASKDGTVEYIRENFPEIYLIELKENLGFGKGNNIALKYALEHNCDYVFLLNQDAWVEPNTIEGLIKFSEQNPEYGILSPIHLNAERTKLNMMLEYKGNICSKAILSDLYCYSRMADIYETDYVNAAAWLLPRKTLETVGGFDPIFMHYGEDDDYLNRTIYHQLKIGICPSLKIVHDHQKMIHPFANSASRHTQYLLANLCNINSSMSFSTYYRFYIRKICSYVVKGQWCKIRGIWKEIQCISHNKNRIKESRKINIIKGSSWL